MKKTRLLLLILCLCLVAPSVSYMNVERVSAAEENSGDTGIVSYGIGDLGDALMNFLKKFLDGLSYYTATLFDRVPDKEFKLLNSVLAQETNYKVEYRETKDAEPEEKEMTYKRWFDLSLYNNRHNIINGGGLITGEEIMIPGNIPQVGIQGDYTNINYPPGNWIYDCKVIYDLWKSLGSQSDRGIATINGYYLIATVDKFGHDGDLLGVHLEDGTVINCIKMDTKKYTDDNSTNWGHAYSGGVSVIEWEANGGKKGEVSSENVGVNLDLTDWKGKKVVSIVNGGPYIDGVTGPGGAGAAHKAEDDEPHYNFMYASDNSHILEVDKHYMDTQWAALENLMVSIYVNPEVKALLSERMEQYADKMDAAAKKYGFTVYKELFKALAQERSENHGDDIFNIKNTSLNPTHGAVTVDQSIDIAAQFFARCLEAANYPDPSSPEQLKALLQAFEFEKVGFITRYDNKYTVENAEKYAAIQCNNKKRTNQMLIDSIGLYDYKDQKYPPKVLKYYSVISVDMSSMTAEERQLLTEAMASWPSDLDMRRKALLEKAISAYGRITYSQRLDLRLSPTHENPAYLDCSSFVGWAYHFGGKCMDVYEGMTTATIHEQFRTISESELIPGDAALWRDTVAIGNDNHTGIYLGKSASGENVWIHCTGVKGPPFGKDGVHTLNKGIKIQKNYPWALYKRYPGFGNK